mgnify:CR=1 FL=1
MVSDCPQGLKITAKSLILQHYCERSEPFFTLTYPTPIFQSSHYIFIQIQFKSYSKVHLTQLQYSKVLPTQFQNSKAHITQLQYSKAHPSQLFQSSSDLTHQTRFQHSKAHLTQLQHIFNFPTPYSYCVPI